MRPDETYHRLMFWTYAQALSERLAGHLLAAEGYKSVDPSHPLGGRDQGADATCVRDGQNWVMASWFPYGPHDYADIEKKLLADIEAGRHREPHGFAFVCNQKITNGERARLKKAAGQFDLDVFHIERNVHILDQPLMAQIREQYVYIPATGLPPMDIKASVVAGAQAFVNDNQLLDNFVAIREHRIRERSEEGHARVRAEKAAKERKIQARRDREAAEGARTALERPWDIGAQMPRITDFVDSRSILGALPRVEVPYLPLYPGQTAPPKPPEPLSENQIVAKVEEYRTALEARWPSCRDYLASVAWPSLRIRVSNDAESFLSDVQIILTFHGARGIPYKGLSSYKFQKVQDPKWRPSRDPGFATIDPGSLQLARSSEYPVDWDHNDDGDLEVTITLPQLRPHPVWRSETHGKDIVLIVDSEVDEIVVSYTVTANGYGKPFIGDPFIVPIDRVDMYAVLKAVDAAAKKGEAS